MKLKHENLEFNKKYSEDIDLIKREIIVFKDFPKHGIHFTDTFSFLLKPIIFQKIVDVFCDVISQSKADVVVGLEARGFTFGGAVCYKLKLPFVPIRKKNKLPGSVNTENYNKSYGEDSFQIQVNDSVKAGQNVVLIDDVISSGASVKASIKLVESLKATVTTVLIIIGFEEERWLNTLSDDNINLMTLFKYIK